MRKFRFSLRYKFLAMTSALLVLSVGVHLWLSTGIFKEDKESLIFDLNRSLVSTLQSDLSNKVTSAYTQLALAALPNGVSGEVSDLIFAGKILPDGNLLRVNISKPFLESYGLQEDQVLSLLQDSFLKVRDQIQKQGRGIWPMKLGQIPALGVARIVISEDSQGRRLSQSYVIGILDLEKFHQAVRNSQTSTVSVFTLDGLPIIEASGRPYDSLPLVQRAKDNVTTTSVLRYEDAGQSMLGAFSKGPEILVTAEVKADKAFSVVKHLMWRSLLFGIMTVSVAFLLILVFSKSITKPLDALVERMEMVAEGNLDVQAQVQSSDEISVLSRSFNEMIREVRSSRHELEETNRTLERKVQERTQQLDERNQAVKEAQEALLRTTRLASVGEVAGQTAHEVLNPLTGIMARLSKIQSRIKTNIRANSEVLTEIPKAWNQDRAHGFDKLVDSWKRPSEVTKGATLFDEDVTAIQHAADDMKVEIGRLDEDTEFLLSEAQRINRIVSQMRSLSHVSRENRAEHVHQLVRQTEKIMADLFEKGGVRLEVEIQNGLDKVQLNRDEFIQALSNLLRNSLHALMAKKDNGAVCKIKCRSEGDHLIIEVYDNGAGMSDEVKQRVFKTNFTTKTSEDGTGLGLSIARRFIRGAGGDITLVESTLGEGTCFRVTLPLKSESERVGA